MSNTYFRFRQFTVHQDRAAMKVSTDACIQGAWTPAGTDLHSMLDIGAGTGLLSLMLAQRQPALHIDAVELDPEAALQAQENIQASPFADRIQAHHADIRYWLAERRYDLILCNPPFFRNSLRSTDAERKLARHDDQFSREDMAAVCRRLLQPGGCASILLPASEQEAWEAILKAGGLYVQQRLLVRPYAHTAVNRVISLCNLSGTTAADEELVIYRQPGQYTESFAALLRPYYLDL